MMAIALLLLVTAWPHPAVVAQDVSATPSASEQLAALGWLAGEWRGHAGREDVVSWHSDPSGGMIVMTTKELRDGQLTLFDFGVISVHNGAVEYVPYPNGKPSVSFTLVDFDSQVRRAIFANDAHDFPKRFIWERTAEDRLSIRLTGDENGQPAEVVYDLALATPTPLPAPTADTDREADTSDPAAEHSARPGGVHIQIKAEGNKIIRPGAEDLHGWSAVDVSIAGAVPLRFRLKLAPGFAPDLFQDLVAEGNAGQVRRFAVQEMDDQHLVATLDLKRSNFRVAGWNIDVAEGALKLNGQPFGKVKNQGVVELSQAGVLVDGETRGPLPAKN